MPKLSLSMRLAGTAAALLLAACGASAADQASLGDTGVAAAGTRPADVTTNASAAANEAVVRRFFEATNRGDWAVAESLVAPGYVHHTPEGPVDWAAWRRGDREFSTAFQKGQQTLEHIVVAGDRVAVLWTGRATHRATFAGIPATGREVTGRGAVFFRIVDGQIAEDWEVFDSGAFMRQLQAPGSSPGR